VQQGRVYAGVTQAATGQAITSLEKVNMAAPNVIHRSKSGKILKRGLIPTPRHKLAAATPHQIRGTTPAQVIVVPPKLSEWLNDQEGDCVTAEEAFAKAAYSVMNKLPELFIQDATVQAFCNKYGFANGAMLPDVMDKMISDGFQQDGQTYKDGPYAAVDYSNEPVLQNALSLGPVKIGIDANALPSGAGNSQGWSANGGSPGQYSSEDHCVALCGYGPSAALFSALGAQMPGNFPTNGYLLYTWSTIGVVDHDWIMSTCGEAWLRNPTTPGVVPVPPPPPPPPPPGPGPGGTMTLAEDTKAGTYALTSPTPPVRPDIMSELASLDLRTLLLLLIQILQSLLQVPPQPQSAGKP
jgi:hypothetical protein